MDLWLSCFSVLPDNLCLLIGTLSLFVLNGISDVPGLKPAILILVFQLSLLFLTLFYSFPAFLCVNQIFIFWFSILFPLLVSLLSLLPFSSERLLAGSQYPLSMYPALLSQCCCATPPTCVIPHARRIPFTTLPPFLLPRLYLLLLHAL